ncbi:unnamed protein product [Moneuplotes crassus]|uniref:Uncharacterized protein n=1 Tax=Euplotes crassus TaxID=5936 RepID=A0AAD1U3W8_EUPCR|nr:unnamed protein product [Moneuplotes crassus]
MKKSNKRTALKDSYKVQKNPYRERRSNRLISNTYHDTHCINDSKRNIKFERILSKYNESNPLNTSEASMSKRSNSIFTKKEMVSPMGYKINSVRRLQNRRSSDHSDSYSKYQTNPDYMIDDIATTKSINNKIGTSYTFSNPKTSVQSLKQKSKPKKVKKVFSKVKVDLAHCKYDCIKKIATEKKYGFGWKLISDAANLSSATGNEFDICWHDTGVTMRFFQQMKLHQVCNHFPGMNQITRKNTLALTLKKIQKEEGNQEKYDFFPRTWVLPTEAYELNEFVVKMKKKSKFFLNLGKQGKLKKDPCFIVKPEAGAQGKGIYLTKKMSDIPTSKKCVVQEYIPNPFLIDGYKFDLRIYVLVTRVEPLSIFVYKEGLARFCTEKYDMKSINKEDEKSKFTHLTNFAINKQNVSEEAESISSPEDKKEEEPKDFGIKIKSKKEFKKLMSEVLEHLEFEGVDKYEVWDEIKDIIRKTIMSIQDNLSHSYKSLQPRSKRMDMCFEILGFDIMIDSYGQPWLIEVNQAPSFATGSEIDRKVKEGLISDTFKILNINPRSKRRKLQLNAKEIQERSRNNHNSKENSQAHTNYEEREMYKQMRYELRNKGDFEKIYTILKPKDDGHDSDTSDEYIDTKIPAGLSDFRSDFNISDEENSPSKNINTINESDEEIVKLTDRVKSIIKTPQGKNISAKKVSPKPETNDAMLIRSSNNSNSILPEIRRASDKQDQNMYIIDSKEKKKYHSRETTKKIKVKRIVQASRSPFEERNSIRKNKLSHITLSKAKLSKRLDKGIPIKDRIGVSSKRSLMKLEEGPHHERASNQHPLMYNNHNENQHKNGFKYYGSIKPGEDYNPKKPHLYYKSRRERHKMNKIFPLLINHHNISAINHRRDLQTSNRYDTSDLLNLQPNSSEEKRLREYRKSRGEMRNVFL